MALYSLRCIKDITNEMYALALILTVVHVCAKPIAPPPNISNQVEFHLEYGGFAPEVYWLNTQVEEGFRVANLGLADSDLIYGEYQTRPYEPAFGRRIYSVRFVANSTGANPTGANPTEAIYHRMPLPWKIEENGAIHYRHDVAQQTPLYFYHFDDIYLESARLEQLIFE